MKEKEVNFPLKVNGRKGCFCWSCNKNKHVKEGVTGEKVREKGSGRKRKWVNWIEGKVEANPVEVASLYWVFQDLLFSSLSFSLHLHPNVISSENTVEGRKEIRKERIPLIEKGRTKRREREKEREAVRRGLKSGSSWELPHFLFPHPWSSSSPSPSSSSSLSVTFITFMYSSSLSFLSLKSWNSTCSNIHKLFTQQIMKLNCINHWKRLYYIHWLLKVPITLHIIINGACSCFGFFLPRGLFAFSLSCCLSLSLSSSLFCLSICDFSFVSSQTHILRRKRESDYSLNVCKWSFEPDTVSQILHFPF